MAEHNDHETLLLLVQTVENLKQEIQKMSVSLENLKNSFPTRSEFEVVKIAVMGVANDGGLVKKVEDLEKLNIGDIQNKANILWDLRWKIVALAFLGGIVGELALRFIFKVS